jgi:UDP:flavonoid glycosyltransferase YjiC (YdhE family)
LIQPAVEALCREAGEFCGVISVVSNICSLDELQLQQYQDSSDQSIIVTKDFLPVDKIASMVNVVLMHGGQGTVQSALAAGVPIVGVAMQFEQHFNLANVERHGAGIQLSQESWTVDNIHAALKRVLGDPSFERAAQRVKAEMEVVDGSRNAAARIVNFAKAHSR